MSESSDRRRVPRDRRRAGRVAATFAVRKSLGASVQMCLAEDIGAAGMTIRRPKSDRILPRTPVALRFALPDTGREIAARGIIVSDSTAGRYRRTGVRFIAIRPDEQSLIAAYVSRAR